MIDWGIITSTTTAEEKTMYKLQEAYCDDHLLEDLSKMLIPYMNKMREGIDFSQIKISSTEAVIKNLFILLRLFQSEIEKEPFHRRHENNSKTI